MSDVTDQYLLSWGSDRKKKTNTTPSEELSVDRTPSLDGQTDQFHTGLRSQNEQDFKSIRPKLVMKIFDEYSNILRCMSRYSIRFNGCTTRSGTSSCVIDLKPVVLTSLGNEMRGIRRRGILNLINQQHLGLCVLWGFPGNNAGGDFVNLYTVTNTRQERT